jgi:hypothetical protein
LRSFGSFFDKALRRTLLGGIRCIEARDRFSLGPVARRAPRQRESK